MRPALPLLMGIVVFVLFGCVAPPPPPKPLTLAEQTGLAVDQLVAGLPVVPQATTVLVATAADLRSEGLWGTSNFGRLITQQIAERLAQHGFRVPEVRLARGLLVKDGGQFILSRRLRDIGRINTAQLAVAATFTGIGPLAYVNLELIRLADKQVVAAADFQTRRIGEY